MSGGGAVVLVLKGWAYDTLDVALPDEYSSALHALEGSRAWFPL
jgi:hypothetical protein